MLAKRMCLSTRPRFLMFLLIPRLLFPCYCSWCLDDGEELMVTSATTTSPGSVSDSMETAAEGSGGT